MGRPPSGGAPAFRFIQSEIAEMETILQVHNNAMPSNDVLTALAEKFSESDDRKGKTSVQTRQVWHWFQNKRYAIRSRNSASSMNREESSRTRSVFSPAPAPPSVPVNASVPPHTAMPAPTPRSELTTEFEAKSARDGAWYDVGLFLADRKLESSDLEVLVQFSGFGKEEAEWVNVQQHIRMRSLPCISSECSTVLPGDLVLCFQDVKEQALYFDGYVLDVQRRRHDARGCRCRFLVRYDHDETEELVELIKICRRPETNYRLQRSVSTDQQRSNINPLTGSAPKVSVV